MFKSLHWPYFSNYLQHNAVVKGTNPFKSKYWDFCVVPSPLVNSHKFEHRQREALYSKKTGDGGKCTSRVGGGWEVRDEVNIKIIKAIELPRLQHGGRWGKTQPDINAHACKCEDMQGLAEWW